MLVAFGAVGFVDALGSLALSYHFHNGLRHDRLSNEIEGLAHSVVLIGLLVVGGGSIVGGLLRLSGSHPTEGSSLGLLLAASSFAVLTVLSVWKQAMARRVASPALLSDGHLSAIGAMQAAVALAGTAVVGWLGWTSADAIATAIVGGVAVSIAVLTRRSDVRTAWMSVRPEDCLGHATPRRVSDRCL